MPIEFIGLISTSHASEIHGGDGPLIDRDYVRTFARAHEESDFDRVLIGYSSSSPDNTQVAAYAATHTDRLGFLVAHRPGFVFPTVAARTFATLDQFTQGRIAFHTITGGHDAEQRRDGDYLTKDQRYRRSGEFLQVLKQAWTADDPFSFDGEFYKFEDYLAQSVRTSSRGSRTTSAARHLPPMRSAPARLTSLPSSRSRWPRSPRSSTRYGRPLRLLAVPAAAVQRVLPADPRGHRGGGRDGRTGSSAPRRSGSRPARRSRAGAFRWR